MESLIPELILLFALFMVSLFYSSVGHGGASGYIALMTLWGIEVSTVRSTALVLNCFVSLVAFIQYQRQGHFRWKLFYPFIITSIPCAYLGSQLALDVETYKRILSVLLLISVARLSGYGSEEKRASRELNIAFALLAGIGIGFLSGLMGIGGGILLSPLILLLGWAGMKQTAAVSSLFIFVNSLAGLAGLYSLQQIVVSPQIIWWLVVTLGGAFVGAFWGSKFAGSKQLGYVLGGVLTLASVKLFFY